MKIPRFTEGDIIITKIKTNNSGVEQKSSNEENISKMYDLEERTYLYAKRINEYVNELPYTIPNRENGKQLVKAGGSVGANYIEANESLSKKDFKMRIKIAKKESKEARYWLRLTIPDEKNNTEKDYLIQESTELMKIFASILTKGQDK